MEFSTKLIHAEKIHSSKEKERLFKLRQHPDPISPSISVSTTFNRDANLESHVYSRLTNPSRDLLEHTLGLLEGTTAHALTYSSGLAAAHAAFMFFKPKRIAITAGYHGVHGILHELEEASSLEIIPLDLNYDYKAGDLIWLETPLNGNAEVRNVKKYLEIRDKINNSNKLSDFDWESKQRVNVAVDATFGPPPLQNLLAFGVDLVMHSGTKYITGHSDALIGLLLVDSEAKKSKLYEQRVVFGAVPGSLEVWLCIRSLKTLELRVMKHASNAMVLAHALDLLTKFPSRQVQQFTVNDIKKYLESMNADEPVSRPIEQELVDVVVSVTKHFDSLKGISDLQSRINQILKKIMYPALELKKNPWIKEQMPKGYGGVFFVMLAHSNMAEDLLLSTKLWNNATSLGGVESLIDWRYRWDDSAPKELMRFSTGIENTKDLMLDLLDALFIASDKVKAKNPVNRL